MGKNTMIRRALQVGHERHPEAENMPKWVVLQSKVPSWVPNTAWHLIEKTPKGTLF